MKRIRRVKTAPEELVALELRKLGLRYRRAPRDLPGSPDFANKRKHWAIFVNGCYWHHHEHCPKATVPTRNKAFWIAKFMDNRRRDRVKIKALQAQGFCVATIWECQAANPSSIKKQLLKISRPLV